MKKSEHPAKEMGLRELTVVPGTRNWSSGGRKRKMLETGSRYRNEVSAALARYK